MSMRHDLYRKFESKNNALEAFIGRLYFKILAQRIAFFKGTPG